MQDWQYRALIFLIADAQARVRAEQLSEKSEWEPDPSAGSVAVMRQRYAWRYVDKMRRRIAVLAPGRDLDEVLEELNQALRLAHAEAWDAMDE